jgi:trigger factor
VLKTSVERTEKTDAEKGEARGNVVKLTVTVPADEVERTLDGTYKKLSAKYRFPGFRPGKAPRQLLDQQLGRDYILAQAAEEVVNKNYPLALDAENLRPIESPEIEEFEPVVPGDEYTFSAEVEVRPEFELASYEGLEIAMPDREATQEDIDAQLEIHRERFATLEPVEDRGVAADDFVLISFVGTVDGEAYEGNEVDKYLYEMGRGLMPPEFDAGIVGAKAGEERKIEFGIPDTSSNPEFVGKTAQFAVTVHEIKAKKLPEVDNEFAGNVGGFDSVDEMLEDMKNRINVQKATAHDRLKERRIREMLAGRLVGDVPESMVTQRQSTMMSDFIGMLEARELSLPQYLENAGVDMETLDRDIKLQAEESVKEDLALEALGRHEGIEVTDADIDEELDNVAKSMDSTPEEARAKWLELGLMVVVREEILRRKAYGWADANVNVVEETAAEDAGAGTKKSAPKKAAAKKTVSKKKADKTAEKGEE